MTVRRPRSLPLAAALLVVGVACSPKQAPTPPPPTTPPAAEAEEPEPEVPCNYLVVIDAGSSGSRAYTYQITMPEGGGVPTELAQRSDAKVTPGLSSFKGEPAKAAASIQGLLAAEESVLAVLPETCKAKTPVAVMATAGMRLLEGDDGGEAAAQAIYGAVSEQVKEAGLDLRFAGTISGTQEALYAWLTANYALGTLTDAAAGATVGALDLGGASTQIAFEVKDPGGVPTTAITLGGRPFTVYAHSYLGYGQDVARQYLTVAACDHKGQGKGTGKYAACVKALGAAVKPKACAAERCGLAAPGDPAKPGVAQPAIPAGMTFYAVGAYFFTRDFFGLPENATPAQLREAAGGPKGAAGHCGTPWAKVVADYPDVPENFLGNYCFSASWIAVLLENLGFAGDNTQLRWTPKVGEVEAGWTLGAALCSVTGCLAPR